MSYQKLKPLNDSPNSEPLSSLTYKQAEALENWVINKPNLSNGNSFIPQKEVDQIYTLSILYGQKSYTKDIDLLHDNGAKCIVKPMESFKLTFDNSHIHTLEFEQQERIVNLCDGKSYNPDGTYVDLVAQQALTSEL